MMISDVLAEVATGRTWRLFTPDLAACEAEIARQLRDARVLVIGGAGSIGSSTARLLALFETAALHVVDVNENSLVELVRDLRGSNVQMRCNDFQLLPLEFGSPVMHRFIAAQAPYDFVLNFAAVKHVRSEKEVCSLLHMVDTNVLKQARLLRWLHELCPGAHYFSVSTDKAANPVNLMGATKRLMEHVMFSSAAVPEAGRFATSARFANVAFSDGSLLQGWLRRIEKNQPLAVPRSTRRFFVSMREAGDICLIAALAGQRGNIIVPRLDPETDLLDLQSVAVRFLRSRGLDAVLCDSVEAAHEWVMTGPSAGKYPLVLTPLDTSGEKPFEEFVGAGEVAVEIGLPHLVAVPYKGLADPQSMVHVLAELERLVADPARPTSKEDIVALLAPVVPEFAHVETGKRLDDRF